MAERKSWAVNQVGAVGQVTVEDARLATSALWTPTGAITSRTGMVPISGSNPPGTVLATTPTPNGFVHVQPFRAVLQSSRGGGTYVMTLDAIKDINILGTAPADPANPRNDLIVFQQNDAYFSDADSNMTVRHIVGTPAGTPVDPTITGSQDYILKARIVVPANTTDIETADITNFTIPTSVATGGVLPVADATERDAIVNPYEGMTVYRADRDWIETRTGSAWIVPSVPVVSATSQVSTPYAGQLVVNTTDNIVYRYTGTAWLPVLPLGGTTDATRQEVEFQQIGTGQSIPSGTDTRLRIDQINYQSNNIALTASEGGHFFTLGLAGSWTIDASSRFAASSNDDEFAMAIASNAGATGTGRYRATNTMGNNTSRAHALFLSCTRRFAAGDTIAIWLYQNSGGAISLENALGDNRVSLTWNHG